MDQASTHDAIGVSQQSGEASASSGSTSDGKNAVSAEAAALQHAEDARQQEEYRRKVLSANFVPVIAIMFCWKSFPALDTGDSQIPLLISVLVAPRILANLEENYDFTGFPTVVCWMITAAVSVLQFASVVALGKNMGYFRPVGEKAIGVPAQSVKELDYIQGTPIDVRRPGTVSVVEFWATWCGPCEKAIPKLNEIVKKLEKEVGKDKIQFVGVTNEDADTVKPFLEKMKGKMDYNVASDINSTLQKGYPTSGIPHAYIVGKDGRICWSGHPMAGMVAAIEKALDATPAARPVAAEDPKGATPAPDRAASAPAGPKKAVIVD